MIDNLKIADFFIKKAIDSKFKGEYMSNLKLQKLMYYAYVWLFALQGERLFEEKLEAWPLGPVLPSLYHNFKNGDRPIEVIETDPELLPDDIKEYLDSIWHSYGQYSALALVNIVHREAPWVHAYNSNNTKKIITDESILDFYTESRASNLLPMNTVITFYNDKKTLMPLSDEIIRRIETPEYEDFDINTL